MLSQLGDMYCSPSWGIYIYCSQSWGIHIALTSGGYILLSELEQKKQQKKIYFFQPTLQYIDIGLSANLYFIYTMFAPNLDIPPNYTDVVFERV